MDSVQWIEIVKVVPGGVFVAMLVLVGRFFLQREDSTQTEIRSLIASFQEQVQSMIVAVRNLETAVTHLQDKIK